ncbi:MAG: tetratricopeptide repeat protein [Myxococcota bacterium]|nr:tetratricopeptide repeat protein [Myxococcota bacterium]
MVVRVLLAVVLAGVTAFVYAPVAGFAFVSLDDPLYITGNEWVLRGLDVESVEWAFTRSLGANWLPLTFMSHMLDVEWFGLDPGAHHVTNLVLHIVATLLLFAVLISMTGRSLPSALVAAAFALHPLHVESVAWVTERKDVLSGVFAFATIAAYLRFARLGGAGRYLVVTIVLLLGLMSKAMLVTLPFVLLLLDGWPLGRIAPGSDSRLAAWLASKGGAERPGRYRPATPGQLAIEKLPLIGVVLVISVVTYWVQQHDGAMAVGRGLSLPERMANVVYSYGRYLELHLWPHELSVQVPHPFLPGDGGRGLTAASIVTAGLAVCAALAVAVREGGAVGVGVAWFLGMLVPVIGLVQIGPQGMADRYSYLPSVGLFLALVWPVAEWLRGRAPGVRWLGAVFATGLISALAVATSYQLVHWHGSLPLFEHAIAVDPGNHLARFGLASVYRSVERNHDALQQYRHVLDVSPQSARAHNGMGAVLRLEGELPQAIEHLELALALKPDLVLAHNNLGLALRSLGDWAGAERAFRAAIRHDPNAEQAPLNLARLLRQLGRNDEAIAAYRAALVLRPDSRVGRRALARLLSARGENEAAEAMLRRLLDEDPNDRAARSLLDELVGASEAER